MPNPSSSRPGRNRGPRRGTGQTKLGPDVRKANLRESLAPRATGIEAEVQKQLIIELLAATESQADQKKPPKT